MVAYGHGPKGDSRPTERRAPRRTRRASGPARRLAVLPDPRGDRGLPGDRPRRGDRRGDSRGLHAVPPAPARPVGRGGGDPLDQGRAVVGRGEVWWVEDPEAGRRPHLVLTRAPAIPVLHSLLAVPATTTVRRIPTEVRLSTEDGMPRACALSLDNLTLMPKAFFRERI